jgi:uncharacterized protein (TIGR03083 family)
MLSRSEIVDGYINELSNFEALIRSLDAKALQQPSRCEGWTVGDVAAHVVGGTADVVNFRLEGAGTPEWTAKQVSDRKGRSAAELADELQGSIKLGRDLLAAFDDDAWNGPAPFDAAPSIGNGVEGLWYDTYVHSDDIRSALGQATVPGPGLRASVIHLAGLLNDRQWGPAQLTLDGVEPVAVGAGGTSGGKTVTGDAHQFVLAATGRVDPTTVGLDATVNVYGG